MRDILISDTIEKIADYYNRVAESIPTDKLKYIGIKRCYDLINGENPYQKAEVWKLEDKTDFALSSYQLISDNKPCYTNMADLDAISETITKLSCSFRLQYNKQPYITIAAKHGNACGIGVDWEFKEASIEKALWSNPIAIWGGEVIVNFKLSSKEGMTLISSEKKRNY